MIWRRRGRTRLLAIVGLVGFVFVLGILNLELEEEPEHDNPNAPRHMPEHKELGDAPLPPPQSAHPHAHTYTRRPLDQSTLTIRSGLRRAPARVPGAQRWQSESVSSGKSTPAANVPNSKVLQQRLRFASPTVNESTDLCRRSELMGALANRLARSGEISC